MAATARCAGMEGGVHLWWKQAKSAKATRCARWKTQARHQIDKAASTPLNTTRAIKRSEICAINFHMPPKGR